MRSCDEMKAALMGLLYDEIDLAPFSGEHMQALGAYGFLSKVKGNPVRVRYIMNKIGGAWQVAEYEVFGEKDIVTDTTKFDGSIDGRSDKIGIEIIPT